MKKTLLCSLFLVILSSFAYAQKKDVPQLLCKRWVVDKNTMNKQAGKDNDYKDMVNRLDEFDVVFDFSNDGTVVIYEGGEGMRYKWKLSHDYTAISLSENITFYVVELTDKKFSFFVNERKNFILHTSPVDNCYQMRRRIVNTWETRPEEEKVEEKGVEEKKEEEKKEDKR